LRARSQCADRTSPTEPRNWETPFHYQDAASPLSDDNIASSVPTVSQRLVLCETLLGEPASVSETDTAQPFVRGHVDVDSVYGRWVGLRGYVMVVPERAGSTSDHEVSASQ